MFDSGQVPLYLLVLCHLFSLQTEVFFLHRQKQRTFTCNAGSRFVSTCCQLLFLWAFAAKLLHIHFHICCRIDEGEYVGGFGTTDLNAERQALLRSRITKHR